MATLAKPRSDPRDRDLAISCIRHCIADGLGDRLEGEDAGMPRLVHGLVDVIGELTWTRMH